MDELQKAGGTIPGRRDAPLASPGGNSPVLGASTQNIGGSQGGIPATGSPVRAQHEHAELPHRGVTWQDETTRAGEHRYRSPPSEIHERAHMNEEHQDYTVPVLVGGAIGTVALAWYLAKLSQQNHRSHWQDRDLPRRGWRDEHQSFDTHGSLTGYGKSSQIATDENWNLIASNKVEGTAVYDRKGEKLGSVLNFMVGKRSGQVAYAVMSFGGWLGMGESYHALPWNTLTYDTDRGGYVVSLDKDRLKNAPSHSASQDVSSDANYWGRVKNYWA